jgi:hypothetical protein
MVNMKKSELIKHITDLILEYQGNVNEYSNNRFLSSLSSYERGRVDALISALYYIQDTEFDL